MSRRKSRQHRVSLNDRNIRFENLEARQLLAISIDSGLNYAGFDSSSRIFQLEAGTPFSQSLQTLRTHVGATDADSFRLISSEVDQQGFVHERYQQMFRGVDVVGGRYSVHGRNGEVTSLSGEFFEIDVSTTTNAGLGNALAADRAVKFMQSHEWEHGTEHDEEEEHHSDKPRTFSWEDPVLSKLIGLENPLDGVLHYLPAEGGVRLTYQFDIYVTAPEILRSNVFVDANSGEIAGYQDLVHAADIPADGPSLYDGTVNFTADVQLVGPNFEYRLRQAAQGVQTFNMNNGTNYGAATDFISVNSSTFNGANHDIGVSAHWGTEKTQQYYQFIHGRNSFDNAGSVLRSYVRYSNNYVNAFWNGSFMTYGDGNGTTFGPLVSLDVVGHEITHGVTQHTANLVYYNESGALNESFSDVFGEAVERYARGSNDWLIGADFDMGAGNGFRSMSNPNAEGDPDTYRGLFWYTGTGDNGGVHINSGVQNKWFYILTTGEAGTNDHGYAYNVAGIGMDDAAAIAYRNLSVYLTPNSTYQHARDGAIQAAIDLFGVGSPQQLATAQAWDAVGVYATRTMVHFEQVAPEGSLTYDAKFAGSIGAGLDNLYGMLLDGGQKVSIVVEGQAGGLLPQIEIMVNGGAPFMTATPSFGNTTVIQSLGPIGAGDYTVRVSGASGSAGTYDVRFVLNANIEEELYGGAANDTFATSAAIDPSEFSLGTATSPTTGRVSVVGQLGASSTYDAFESFESGALDARWSTFKSHPLGQIQVATTHGASDGTYALAMDTTAFSSFNLNEAILTIDATALASPILRFDHIRFGDENHVLPGKGFAGHYNGDGVSISDDGSKWFPVGAVMNIPSNTWRTESIDLQVLASNFGITLGPNFRIKFQQYDNQSIANADGRAFDNIRVGSQVSLEDWYSVAVSAGERISLFANQLDNDANTVSIELYDPAGTLVTSGVAGAHVDSRIEDFLVGTAGDWRVRVSGQGNYNLNVLRNAAFDHEAASSTSIDLLSGALGHVSGFASQIVEPDHFSHSTLVNTAWPGVVLSNNGAGNVYVADTTFYAPTGIRAFAPTSTSPFGWHGTNVLRADFASPVSFVSIDVGSDDGNDRAYLRAYDSTGALLQEVFSGAITNNNRETISISRPTNDIAWILSSAADGDATPLDRIVFKQADLDTDEYTFTASAGQGITLTSFLPGDGSREFVNLLGETGPNHLQMTLLDPSNVVVATGSAALVYSTRVAGTYRLIVSANDHEGEYYIEKSVLDLSHWQFDFGIAGSKIDTGYVEALATPFDATAGFGWTVMGDVAGWIGTLSKPLLYDGVAATSATFEVEVVNGDYNVELHFGELPALPELAEYTVEGTLVSVAPALDTIVLVPVFVTDGRLTLTLDGSSGADPLSYISGLRIHPTYPAPSPFRDNNGESGTPEISWMALLQADGSKPEGQIGPFVKISDEQDPLDQEEIQIFKAIAEEPVDDAAAEVAASRFGQKGSSIPRKVAPDSEVGKSSLALLDRAFSKEMDFA